MQAKTDNQRVTIKQFIFHDVLNGTLHLEKEILTRDVLFFVLMFFEIFALLIISIGILTNWQSQEVIISPF